MVNEIVTLRYLTCIILIGHVFSMETDSAVYNLTATVSVVVNIAIPFANPKFLLFLTGSP
jgi:hypothetical protein